MARRSLKDLQNKISSESNEGGSNAGFYYPHWKLPKDGQTNIRILEDPDLDNELIVYINFMEHVLHIGDEIIRVPCRKNNGKDQNCPICDMSSKLYKSEQEERGKYFYREMYAVLRGLVTKDGLEYAAEAETAEGTVKVFKFSYQLGSKLKVEIGKLESDDPDFWDLADGLDFAIVKNIAAGKNGKEYGKYDLASGFVRRSTAIPAEWVANITDEPLSALMPKIPSYDEADEHLQRYLRAELDGTAGRSSGGDAGAPDKVETEEDLMEKINRQQRTRKTEETVEPEVKDTVEAVEDDDDVNPLDSLSIKDDTDDDDILRQLKQ